MQEHSCERCGYLIIGKTYVRNYKTVGPIMQCEAHKCVMDDKSVGETNRCAEYWEVIRK